jgi:hypothetical protein
MPWRAEMSEEERRKLLRRIEASIEEAKGLTPEQAREKLAREGFCDENGQLAPAYGGLKAEHV